MDSIALQQAVALRKESVDRNIPQVSTLAAVAPSLSARRAWIEIIARLPCSRKVWVALRKESVDRNHAADISYIREPSRSPQGERG